jgi:hypothetical protein
MAGTPPRTRPGILPSFADNNLKFQVPSKQGIIEQQENTRIGGNGLPQ